MDNNDLIIYKNSDGNIIVDAIFKDETLWLTQKGMSKVFDCSTDNISLHLKNIFKDNELNEKSVVEDSSVTASDGKNYKTKIYNLDAIIAVGSIIFFIIFLIYLIIIGKRIKNEEKVLEKDLKGYAEYKKKVKYKVIPFVW